MDWYSPDEPEGDYSYLFPDEEPESSAVWPNDFFAADSRGFRCVRQLGEGGFGTAWLIQQTVNGEVVKRFVAKYAQSKDDEDTIETEIQIAKKLYGAMHVAQPIIQSGTMLQLQNKFPDHAKALTPILMTELIPGITVQEFWYRINGNPDRWWPVPNRILWMMFRCLVRSIFAMVNPPNKPLGEDQEPPTLEPLPANPPGPGDYQIIHGDPNNNNVMFGDLDRGEHRLVPILKLIDFGLAKDTDNYPTIGAFASKTNMYHAANIMRSFWDPYSGNLDDDFQTLITECTSLDQNSRPSLDRLWGTIQNAINVKTGPAFFPGKKRAQWETDDIIRQYVQSLLLDADAQTPVAV